MSENYELAYKDYKAKMKYKDIAEKYDVSINTVKSWKSRHWNKMDAGEVTKVAPNKKDATNKKSTHTIKRVQPVIENDNLTEQQKLFCLYYIKTLNATQSYMKAYGVSYDTANSHGYRMLSNVVIKEELDRLKADMQQDLHFDALRVVNEYAKQAFYDISDFVEFGTKEEPELNEFDEQEYDANGNPKIKLKSYVYFKDSEVVDGTLVQEVKMGKDGVSLKMADKQKALDVLLKYTDVDALRMAQLDKARAEAKIAQDKASKLEASGKGFDLLELIYDTIQGGGDNEQDNAKP